MTDATFFNLGRVSPRQQSTASQQGSESQEILWSDLGNLDHADSSTEALADQEMGAAPALKRLQKTMASTELTGGDPDDDAYQASVVGEEAVGGQTPTPDQNVTEELQKAVGIASIEGETVRTAAKLEWRDRHPWGLNPESAEDYRERLE
ncbi:hypothetical protein C1752_08713 [Acaryochloris thomasi RCC1774]|uniref:Uncharacterized protein n=1 Tax=Acaryochloris thomasi RCC1774 TaxID=1764569 RepID=A0A2W1JA97_9CYAN|nr:DUF6335 family protein [Acaryochloris thomasi]PZD70938.1 hypothetical protein C1752_08713 [Acaryochloris thomasi RCC1774]